MDFIPCKGKDIRLANVQSARRTEPEMTQVAPPSPPIFDITREVIDNTQYTLLVCFSCVFSISINAWLNMQPVDQVKYTSYATANISA